MQFLLFLVLIVGAMAFAPTNRPSVSTSLTMKSDGANFKKIGAAVLSGLFTLGTFQAPAEAITKEQLNSLSYQQVKGTGLANRCPQTTGSDTLSVNGKKKIVDFCVEPTIFEVEEEVAVKKGVPVKEFVKTKLMTRQTYSLDGVSGSMEVKDGKATFTEEDGIDYAATTVQLPGGERVPFLFSIKNLVAQGNGQSVKPGFEMAGPFTVPSYRTGLFLDPKGRGTTTGYDQAGALPGIQNGENGDATLFRENNKVFQVLQGDVVFQVDSVNAAEGEFSGKFVSNQPGDTDMGGKDPKNILLKGIFYGRFE
jgi:photosystem II oxygen-evolving enhancer protein 1